MGPGANATGTPKGVTATGTPKGVTATGTPKGVPVSAAARIVYSLAVGFLRSSLLNLVSMPARYHRPSRRVHVTVIRSL